MRIARRCDISYSALRDYYNQHTHPPAEVQRALVALLDEKPPRSAKDEILSLMETHCDEYGVFSKGTTFISEITGYDRGWVSRMLKRLKASGALVGMSWDAGKTKSWLVRSRMP